jgi:hypothetical protein
VSRHSSKVEKNELFHLSIHFPYCFYQEEFSGHPVDMSASRFDSRRTVMGARAVISTTPLGNHVEQRFSHVIREDARLLPCVYHYTRDA